MAMLQIRFRSLSTRVLALSLLPVGLFLRFFAFYELPTLHDAVMAARPGQQGKGFAVAAEGLRAVAKVLK